MTFKFGQHEWIFPGTRVMGILNVTPDSFYDGGRHASLEKALQFAGQMAAQGADVIDIGGESTRPQAAEVSLEEELERVIPVVQLLAARIPVPLSIDTTKAEVARQAVAHGASIINDVSGGRADPDILRVAAETGAGLVLMHSRGNPRTMQSLATYKDVVQDVLAELRQSLERARAAGVRSDRIAVDPGFGFAKTANQSIEVLRNLRAFKALGRPLLIGVSRKSFLGAIVTREANQRLAASVAAQLYATLEGGEILRTHDVAETVDGVRILNAILAADPEPARGPCRS